MNKDFIVSLGTLYSDVCKVCGNDDIWMFRHLTIEDKKVIKAGGSLDDVFYGSWEEQRKRELATLNKGNKKYKNKVKEETKLKKQKKLVKIKKQKVEAKRLLIKQPLSMAENAIKYREQNHE